MDGRELGSGGVGSGEWVVAYAHCPLPTRHSPLPTAQTPLPTAHSPLPTPHCPRPTRQKRDSHSLLEPKYLTAKLKSLIILTPVQLLGKKSQNGSEKQIHYRRNGDEYKFRKIQLLKLKRQIHTVVTHAQIRQKHSLNTRMRLKLVEPS